VTGKGFGGEIRVVVGRWWKEEAAVVAVAEKERMGGAGLRQ
jgi:hypothetical protein